MKFNLNHNPANKTLSIPCAALQISGLAGVSDLLLHTDSGCILLLPGDPTVAELLKTIIITHCAPSSIAHKGSRHNEADPLMDFLQEVQDRTEYRYWLFGHYHGNRMIDTKHILLWEQIVRVL